jgi:hypothetical protein
MTQFSEYDVVFIHGVDFAEHGKPVATALGSDTPWISDFGGEVIELSL